VVDAVAEVRRFNRFYTRQIGLLNEHMPASDLSLAEGRVVYELATGGDQTSADICRKLEMDKAHVSRILARFRKRRLVRGREKPENAKHIIIGLAPAGRKMFARLDAGSRSLIQKMLARVDAPEQRRLLKAFHAIEGALGGNTEGNSASTATEPARAVNTVVNLRRVRVGDLGYVTSRQALLYHQEYGWDWTYEAFMSEILAKFARDFDARRDDGWIAEVGGRTVGSVFLVRSDKRGTAKLRLLYVEPDARGLGIGRRLVRRCMARARELGYRRMELWTNSVLTAARKIYEAEGFRLAKEEHHTSFGKKLVGQNWELALR
jgi:DNA-binding MarR family transcriptional regulator/GNAT superfamily N-acetyltransferase